MRKRLLLVMVLMTIVFGISVSTTKKAHASSTIPSSFRGNWYNFDNNTEMSITARHLKMYTNWKHVKYVTKRSKYYTVHFKNAHPVILWHGKSGVIHLEYGMSIEEIYHKL